MTSTFKRIAAALSLAAPFLLGHAQAAEPIRIGIGYPTPQAGPHGAGAKAFEEELNRLAPGHFKVQHYPSGSLGGEREMVEGVQFGTLEMAITGTAVIGNFVPEMQVMDLPFLFRDSAHARATLDGPIGKELIAKFASHGLIGLGFGEIGFRHLTDSKRPIRTPEDLKGLKIRTMENPVHIAAFRALGALPTPMSWTEVTTALQQGTIDGQENPVSILVSTKLWQVQKYVTLSRHVFTPISFTMSPAFFNKLSPKDQEIVRKAAVVGIAANRRYVDEVEHSGVEELRKNGMQVTAGVDTAAFEKRLEPVYAKYGERFGDLIARIKAVK
jgi:tripartite ATP-independent transporter DctP family solute receptor